MAVDFEFKECYGMDDLISIVSLLRAPGGCPWDREQDHFSIRKNLIEETYEVIEAINIESTEALREELGDVLLQVALHAEMEREAGTFDFDDVCDGICKKLILRHPHVFGDLSADNSEEALTNWDNIKLKTKGIKKQSESMAGVPREFPALMRAQKVQSKASKAGFDWKEISGALDKLYEEINELKAALSAGSSDEVGEEFGDILFSAVNVSRFLNVDSEEALTGATDKFLKRFQTVETLAEEKGIDMKNAPLEQLDALWDEAKLKLSE